MQISPRRLSVWNMKNHGMDNEKSNIKTRSLEREEESNANENGDSNKDMDENNATLLKRYKLGIQIAKSNVHST